jgi:hypothetical protein
MKGSKRQMRACNMKMLMRKIKITPQMIYYNRQYRIKRIIHYIVQVADYNLFSLTKMLQRKNSLIIERMWKQKF